MVKSGGQLCFKRGPGDVRSVLNAKHLILSCRAACESIGIEFFAVFLKPCAEKEAGIIARGNVQSRSCTVCFTALGSFVNIVVRAYGNNRQLIVIFRIFLAAQRLVLI